MDNTTPYFAEHGCSAINKSKKIRCSNKAYFSYTNAANTTILLCGQHSKSIKNRVKLPENPNKSTLVDAANELRNAEIEIAKNVNFEANRRGTVICTKMKMMKGIEYKLGFMSVFPNYKHQGRKDGFGCASLSPKSMGPIVHNQPGLPVALNLENFHQGNKVYPDELKEDGNPNDDFYIIQKMMYENKEPHRHKINKDGVEIRKPNAPAYSIFRRKTISEAIEEVHLSYFESRQLYCNYYERFALVDVNFLKLKRLLADGYNLQIQGYDAYDVPLPLLVTEVSKAATLKKCYEDISRPFGHELALLSLLVLEEAEYPWRLYKTLDF